jgi:thiol:disulfide interchange protein DsbD
MALLRLALFFFLAVTAQAQLYEGRNLVEARLVADTTAIVPGKPFRVGLVLQMAPTWHMYWEYPGDAGVPTSLKWQLPPDFRTGPIEWPLPEATVEPGDIEVYGYSGEVMLIQSIEPPAHLEPGELKLHAGAAWLVCADLCIPGKQDVSLTLPVAAASQPANAELFSKWAARLPLSSPPPFPITWSRHGDALQASFQPGSEVRKAEFFPLPPAGQDVGHPMVTGDGASGFTISITTPGDLRGVLAITDAGGTRSWQIDARPGVQAAPSTVTAALGNPPAQGGGADLGLSLWTALLSGFLGGMILNLMPCVLPVISLKIFGFVRQAGRSRGAILAHGFAFAAGIFAWFLGLGGVIIALRSAGGAATWAFQFQNVWFNVAVAAIVLVFALNLFGVYEVVLPGRAANRLAGAGAQEGWAGSFFQGVFATLLATPCTGPFLGSSLGFAFSQPPVVTMAFFACMAAGMALPYLALSAQPAWLRFLPKPGIWMERLKQFMGFPLIAALLWLLYVIGQLRGTNAIVCVGGFLLSLAIACWIYGLIGMPGARAGARAAGLVAIAILAVGGGWLFLVKFFPQADVPATVAPAESGGIEWQPFSQASLDALLKEGKPVFVDFTAAWCLSCKFNERTAIDTPAVREKLRQLRIVPMRADWTNANPEITAALRAFGRVGVPFYVLYPAGNSEKPILLPELLTESIVLGALSHAR